eukprot:6241748-Amphidinium_carterae.1
MDATTLIAGDIEELNHQANIPRQLRQPSQPTKQEQEEYRITHTHTSRRRWSPICVKAKGQPQHHKKGALKEQLFIQLAYEAMPTSGPTIHQTEGAHHSHRSGTTTGLCLAIPTSEQASELQLAQQAAPELTIPWKTSSSHSHQGQGAIERGSAGYYLHKCNLGLTDNVSERLLPWVLQHACFTINSYLVRSDGLTNYQQPWGIKYNSAICNFGKLVLADIRHITVNKLLIRTNGQKVEGIWLGRTTNK